MKEDYSDEIYEIEYESKDEKIQDKLILPFGYRFMYSLLIVLLIPSYFIILYLTADADDNLGSFLLGFLITLVGGIIGMSIFLSTVETILKFMPYKIRVFYNFFVLPKKYYSPKPVRFVKQSAFNPHPYYVLVFFDEIDSYEIRGSSIKLNFKKSGLMNFIQNCKKAWNISGEYPNEDLPTRTRYPFVRTYNILNLNNEDIKKLSDIFSRNYIRRKA